MAVARVSEFNVMFSAFLLREYQQISLRVLTYTPPPPSTLHRFIFYLPKLIHHLFFPPLLLLIISKEVFWGNISPDRSQLGCD